MPGKRSYEEETDGLLSAWATDKQLPECQPNMTSMCKAQWDYSAA